MNTRTSDASQSPAATARGAADTRNPGRTDVIVVGAGPTGLMLAGELRLGGVDVVVVERLPEPTGQSRGLGFTARAMEVFDQRGLLPRFGPGLESSPQGHFGGLMFDYSVLEDAHFGARGVPQSQVEAVLEEWARELGADIRRGWELTDITERENGVDITARTPGGTGRLRGAYLVGCDGGRSTVRALAGFDFPGSRPRREMYLADVVGCSVKPRFLGERLPGGMVMAAPLGPGVDRVIVCPDGVPAGERAKEITFDEIADSWQRITGEDISGGTAHWVSSFTDTTRQVTQYRRGRVLVAGDAAHIHLPAGGQGLSTGVQDAVNLGWKLAATVQGWAPAGLLDTYHSERHPVGSRLLTNTKVQGQLYIGGEEADPLRELFAELIEYEDVRRHLAGAVSHVDIRYELGADGHPLLGRRLPPRTVTTDAGEVSTASLLHSAQGVLLDLDDDAGLRAAVSGWKDRVVTVTGALGPTAPHDELPGAGSVLVRPDGHIVWTAADGTDPQGALHRWFGTPGTA